MTTVITEAPADLIATLYDSRNDDVIDDWTRVTTQHMETGRWHDHHLLIVRDPAGQHWATDYSLGLTEEQEHQFPWRDDDPVTLVQVHPHAVTTIEYRTSAPDA